MQRSRTPSSTYRNDSYDQNHAQKFRSTNTALHGVNRTAQKRISESSDKESWEVNSKRSKPPNNRNLQEVRKMDTASEPVAEKKVSFLIFKNILVIIQVANTTTLFF